MTPTELQTGTWITFHPTEPGGARIGQIAEDLEPDQWGRACYSVAYWREKNRKSNTAAMVRDTDTITVDRVIGPAAKPPGMAVLIHGDEEETE